MTDSNDNGASTLPPPPPSAAPTGAPKAKKVRIKYPVPESGLTEFPADHDANVHLPLQRNDFKDPTVFLVKRAEEYEARAKDIRAEVEQIRLHGPGAAKKANKLAAMQSQLDALKALLIAANVNVDEELAKLAAGN